MTTFFVFHHKRGNFHFLGDLNETQDFQKNYTLVATVEADSLDHAFQLTNTIDNVWWENDGVKPVLGVPGFRSTSVGDVIMDASTKTLFFCSPVGWTEL